MINVPKVNACEGITTSAAYIKSRQIWIEDRRMRKTRDTNLMMMSPFQLRIVGSSEAGI